MKRALFLLLIILLGRSVSAQPPSWSVTPSSYQYTATLTGVLVINDTIINASNNMLGAFVAGQVRGVASPTNVGGTETYFITLYSNIANGENVTFKAYLAGEDSVYNVLDSIVFTSGSTNGDPVNPFELHLNDNNIPHFNASIYESVQTGQQYSELYLPDYVDNPLDTPITFGIANIGSNLNGSISGDTLYVTHNGSVILDSLRVRILDSTNTSVEFDSQFFLYEVTGINTPISFNPVPDILLGNNSSMCIDMANYLNNLDNDSITWQISGLVQDTIGDTSVSWSVNPANYQYTMNVISNCHINGVELGSGDYLLGAFDSNDNLIGFGSPQQVSNEWITFLTIYSNNTSGYITFRLFDTINDVLYDERTDTMLFVSGGVEGTVASPINHYFGDYLYTSTGSIVCIELFDSTDIVLDTITVIATETLTNEQYSDTTVVVISYFNENQPYLDGILDQEILPSMSFTSFDLDNYLTEIDGDSVLYHVVDTNHITIAIDGQNNVTITPNDGTWRGRDTVIFYATDFTTNQLYDTDTVIYSVVNGIDLSGIPDQLITSLQAFAPVPLNDYLTHFYPDPVNWYPVSNELIHVITNDTLFTYLPYAGWEGYDTIVVTVENSVLTSVFDADTFVYGSFNMGNLNLPIEFVQQSTLSFVQNTNPCLDILPDLYNGDGDTIAWSTYQLNIVDFSSSISNDGLLCITLTDPNQDLTDSVLVIAQETNTIEQYSDSIWITINYLGENKPLIDTIPDQSILSTDIFQSFDLDNYLTELDGDAVVYTVTDTNNVTIVIDGNNVVTITPNSPTWAGSDTIVFKVTDQTTNQLYDNDTVIFSVIENLSLNDIPDQTINATESFTDVLLTDYLNYSVADSVVWTITNGGLVIVENNHLMSAYFPSSQWTGTDTLIIQVQHATNGLLLDADTAVYTVLEPIGGSIEEIASTTFNIYPNPSKGEIFIDIQKLNHHQGLIEIISVSGKVMHTEAILQEKTSIGLELPPGVYFVRIDALTRKVVVR